MRKKISTHLKVSSIYKSIVNSAYKWGKLKIRRNLTLYSAPRGLQLRLILTGVLFIILQFGILFPTGLLSNTEIIPDVCAQSIIDGNSCVPELAECENVGGGNYSNFVEKLNSGGFQILGTDSGNKIEILNRLEQQLNEDYVNACISNDFQYLIQVFNSGGVASTGYELNFCNPGDIGALAPVANGYKVAGCCPSGYQFVSTNDFDPIASGANFQAKSACCEIPSGSRYGEPGYPWELRINNCLDSNRNVVDNVNLIKDRNRIDGLDNGIEEASSNNLFTIDRSASSSPEICGVGEKNGCAIVDINKGATPVNSTQILDSTGGSNLRVVDPNLLIQNSNYSCNSCIPVGGAIAVQGEELLVCDGAGATKTSELINGNVNDTLAYLAAEGDPANQEALKTCRERGGIYTALGCIDPTPTGIITGLIRIALGVTGGIALVQLILAGIAYQSGEEEKIVAAREKVFATIGGLAVLVFSVLILRIIGVNVLDILPGGAI